MIIQGLVQRGERVENLGQVRHQLRVEEGLGEADQLVVDVPVTRERQHLPPRSHPHSPAHLGSAVASARLRIEEHAAEAILQVLTGEVPDGAVNRPLRTHSPGPTPAL